MLLHVAASCHWRRKWQPTPVFLPGESQTQGSLVGCCRWGRTESDTTERLSSSSQLSQYICGRGCASILYVLASFVIN